MYFEEALQLMRKGYYISRGISGEKFRLYEGHFEIVNDDYPNGCHTNVPGDDLSSDRWELADREIYYQDLTNYFPFYVNIRIINSLKWSHGINNKHILIGDIIRCSEHELLRIPNFGHKSLKKLKSFLHNFGLSLGMELSESQLKRLEEIKKLYEDGIINH